MEETHNVKDAPTPVKETAPLPPKKRPRYEEDSTYQPSHSPSTPKTPTASTSKAEAGTPLPMDVETPKGSEDDPDFNVGDTQGNRFVFVVIGKLYFAYGLPIDFSCDLPLTYVS